VIRVRLAALAGQCIAEIRAITGKSQLDLGADAGVDSSMISKYENARVNPDLTTFIALVNAAGWEVVLMTRAQAATAEEREAVVNGARTAQLLPTADGANRDLITAYRRLVLAEQEVAENPLARIEQEMFTEVKAANRRLTDEVRRLRGVVNRIQKELGK